MADNKVIIEISAQGNAEVQINKVTKAVNDLGTQGSSSLSKFTNAFDVFAGTLASNAVTKGFSLLQDAASGLFQTLVVDGVKSAIQAEDALNQLTSALQRAGNFSEETVASFQAFATELQNTTKFEDDAIIKTGALIESLTGLKGKGLEDATLAAANLSAALGIDLETAARKLARANQDGEEGLKKFNVVVKEGATSAETMANAVQKVNEKYGGAAAAQINTYSGAVTLVSHAFGELGETTGGAVTKNDALIGILKEGAKVFAELNILLQSNEGALKSIIANGTIALIGTFTELLSTSDAVFRGMERGINSVLIKWQQLQVLTLSIPAQFSEANAALRDSAQQSLDALRAQNTELEKPGPIIQGLIDGSKRLRDAGLEAQYGIAGAADRTTQSLQNQKVAAEEVVASQQKLIEEGRKLRDSLADQADPQAAIDAKIAALEASFEVDQEGRDKTIAAVEFLESEKVRLADEARNKDLEKFRQNQKDLVEAGKVGNFEQLSNEKQYLQDLLQGENLTAEQREDIERKLAVAKEKLAKSTSSAQMQALGSLAQFQKSKLKELAVIGKAAAVAQATINTFQGATLALANLPPPFSFVVAGATIAAGLANVATIVGTDPGFERGLTEVPPGFRNDTFPARLSSGERVVDSNTNQDLKLFLANSGGMTQLLEMVVNRLDNLENRTIVNIGDREIVNAVQKSIDSGRSLTL